MTNLKTTDLTSSIRGNVTFFSNAEGQVLGCLMNGQTVSAHGCDRTIDVSMEKAAQRYKAARTFIVENARI